MENHLDEFTQDNINELTDHILKDKKLRILAMREDWKELVQRLIKLNIVNYSFLYQYFQELDNVNILKYITRISRGAFYESNIKNIEIPDNIKKIEPYAFESCSELTTVTMGSGVTSIGVEAFRGCTGLKSITIPDSVTSIGDRAFYGCEDLTSITIPSSVTSLGDMVFGYCRKLNSITYRGTRARWEDILEPCLWGCDGDFTIHCLDGEI